MWVVADFALAADGLLSYREDTSTPEETWPHGRNQQTATRNHFRLNMSKKQTVAG
jgi:hypothetical protein